MREIDLFRRPQATIRELLSTDPNPWSLPLIGYFCLSFAEGIDGVVQKYPRWNPFVLILLTAAGALVIGVWAWAGIYGGALHLTSRLVGGKEGASETIRAVGYALFWPGMVAAIAAAIATLLEKSGTRLAAFTIVPLLIQIGAGLWALYTTVASLRSRHVLSWRRAVAAYLLFFLAIVLIAFVVFFTWRILRAS